MDYAIREIRYYTATLREVQSKRGYCLLAQIYKIRERVEPYVGETTPPFST